MTATAGSAAQPRRVAMISVHTSPLDQPGTGDAGGMNVYVVALARQLALRGTQVEVFTRATSSASPPHAAIAEGVTVRSIVAGPFEGLAKEDLPAQLCAMTRGLMRVEASQERGYFDLVHSHYWLSGQVGSLAAERWGVPLVHSMHTMGKVKNAALADGDTPEPAARLIGEEQVVELADRLVANTTAEARQLVSLYDAAPERVAVVPPGVDLEVFSPGSRAGARARLGVDPDAELLVFAGRIQPLKGPEVLLRAAALLRQSPGVSRLQVAVIGGPSGSGLAHPLALQKLAAALGIADQVRFIAPLTQPELADWYRAADLAVVPSYNESFGLVALEAQACGTPVVAANVGGLPTAVADGRSGVLVDGHDPADWARVLVGLLADPTERARLGRGALAHASTFGWEVTAARMLDVYAEAAAQAAPGLGAARR